MRIKGTHVLAIVFGIGFAGCHASNVERSTLHPDALSQFSSARVKQLNASSPYIKAHMKNGRLYLFDKWDVDQKSSTIVGHATLFSPLRDTLGQSGYTIGLDSIAILETNVIENSGSATAITLFMGITAAFTVNCIVNPKSCFGSCPTFYVDDGKSLRLQAEGFSSSISPSLEATDVDALFCGVSKDGKVKVVMKNEALETHVVRHVDLLAVPRNEGCRVFATTDYQFWESPLQHSPVAATGSEGDCLSKVIAADGNERFSTADDKYLGAKEEVGLRFRVKPGTAYGLVVGCRQTLLPTYLLYQTLAYMGNEAGYWLAELERKKISKAKGMEEIIGGIEIWREIGDGQRQIIGQVCEHGPLATDVHLLPLPASRDTILHLQLRMTKGAWRIDYLALAELSRSLQPVRIHPEVVLNGGMEDAHALSSLTDSTQSLVTFPGDEYILQYALPKREFNCEVFVESRGYYFEWMRQEWIKEENPLLLAQVLLDPEGALRRMAPGFKQVEPDMEDCFWSSRYAKP